MFLLEKINIINSDFAQVLKDSRKIRKMIEELRGDGTFPDVGSLSEAVKIFEEQGILGDEDFMSLQENAKELLEHCPWAWFITELKRLYGIKTTPSSETYFMELSLFPEEKNPFSEIMLKKVLYKSEYKYCVKFKDEQGMDRHLGLLKRNRILNLKIARHERLIYCNDPQPISRFLLESNGLERPPNWFKWLVYLCKSNNQLRPSELNAALGTSISGITSAKRLFPQGFFDNFVDVMPKSEKIPQPKLQVKKDFHENVYLPIKLWLNKGTDDPWLDENIPNCYKVFKDWKEVFHWNRETV